MHARALRTLTLILSVSLALVSASPAPAPAPIDPQQANVIAENNNIACSSPHGCAGANGTINTASTSAASPLTAGVPLPVVLGASAGLSLLGLL